MADDNDNRKYRKALVGISSCLLGNKVRYDGGHKHDACINDTLADCFELIAFCPEQGAGLGVPRPPVRLVKKQGQIHVLGVKDSALDVTQALSDYSAKQDVRLSGLAGFVLKKGSPSCGMERVDIYNPMGLPETTGRGIFAEYIQRHYPVLPLEEEGRLADVNLRENFIQRVFIYGRWQGLLEQGLTVKGLTGFHTRLEPVLMNRDQIAAIELGALLGRVTSDNLAAVSKTYITGAMVLLKPREDGSG